MISTGEDDMLVPDFWPESLATPEDRILTYTTPKESYINALKRILQSSAIPNDTLPLSNPIIVSNF